MVIKREPGEQWVNVPKLMKAFEAAGLTQVWADSRGRLTHENATPEQLAQAQQLLEAHDPEDEPDEKRRKARQELSEYTTDNLTALLLELVAWADGRGFSSELATKLLTKEAELKQRHPDRPAGNGRAP